MVDDGGGSQENMPETPTDGGSDAEDADKVDDSDGDDGFGGLENNGKVTTRVLATTSGLPPPVPQALPAGPVPPLPVAAFSWRSLSRSYENYPVQGFCDEKLFYVIITCRKNVWTGLHEPLTIAE